ncbi:MAG: hypothetical protein KZQ83_00275 [gamma proteobacterium symbiont of Taylorina sp.]|nr:hypothetical protein [gamma proteobacterium symbiont of Taylorina sp.]
MKIIFKNWRAYFFIILLYPLYAGAAGTYVLQNTPVIANSSQTAPIIKFTNNGGNITYNAVYNNSCQFTYQMDWEFSKDINSLEDGEEFSIMLQCTNCEEVCGFRWREGKGDTSGTNNILSIPDVDNYIYNGNFELINSSPSVQAWKPETFDYQSDFKVRFLKNAPDSGFYLLLGNHKIFYHYVLEEESSDGCQNTSMESNLDIHIPAVEISGESSDLWIDLKFKGVDSDGDYIWKLNDFGVSQ